MLRLYEIGMVLVYINICFLKVVINLFFIFQKGLGQQRSDIATDQSMPARDRLLRFLQAQGIDTSKLSEAAMEK